MKRNNYITEMFCPKCGNDLDFEFFTQWDKNEFTYICLKRDEETGLRCMNFVNVIIK